MPHLLEQFSKGDDLDEIESRPAGDLARTPKVQHELRDLCIYAEPDRSGLVVRVRLFKRLKYLGVFSTVGQAREARNRYLVESVLPAKRDFAAALLWAIDLGGSQGSSLVAILSDLEEVAASKSNGLRAMLLALIADGQVIEVPYADRLGVRRHRYAIAPGREDSHQVARSFAEDLTRRRRAEIAAKVFRGLTAKSWRREDGLCRQLSSLSPDEIRAALTELEAEGMVRRHAESRVTWWQAVAPLGESALSPVAKSVLEYVRRSASAGMSESKLWDRFFHRVTREGLRAALADLQRRGLAEFRSTSGKRGRWFPSPGP